MWVRNMENDIYEIPPFPFTSGKNEHDIMIDMIETSQSCIHLENQLCISTNSTKNDILRSVIQRLRRSYDTPGDDFHFFLFVNTYQPDENVFVSMTTTATFHWSRRIFYDNALESGIPESFINERVFIGIFEYRDIHVKIHSNLMIQDGHTLLRSSSNLSDRSLSERPCDNELGVVVSDDSVAEIQQNLWKMYTFLPYDTPPLYPRDIISYFRAESGVIREMKSHGDVLIPTPIMNGIMKIYTNLTPAFGGKRHINWTTTSTM
jgi:phosphatidylserine/phosphatidylglycerophosphate/cardiolipin synthase-like enzyme